MTKVRLFYRFELGSPGRCTGTVRVHLYHVVVLAADHVMTVKTNDHHDMRR